jgi:hypothetical protein
MTSMIDLTNESMFVRTLLRVLLHLFSAWTAQRAQSQQNPCMLSSCIGTQQSSSHNMDSWC